MHRWVCCTKTADRNLVKVSEEVIASATAISFLDCSIPEEPRRFEASAALLVRSRARRTEAAILVLGAAGNCLTGPEIVGVIPLILNLELRVVPDLEGTLSPITGGSVAQSISITSNSQDTFTTPNVTLELATADQLEEQLEPTAELQLNGADDIGLSFGERESSFLEKLRNVQSITKRHCYHFPSNHVNHDWIWSYGVERLPAGLRVAQDGVWFRNDMVRQPSMVFGGIHMRTVLSERGVHWNKVQPLLREREKEYCTQIPLRIIAVSLNCAATMPPKDDNLADLFANQRFDENSSSSASSGSADIVFVALQETCRLVLAVDVTDSLAQRNHAAYLAAVSRALAEAGEYVLIADERLVGLQLLAFVRTQLRSQVTHLRAGKVSCGALGGGNKGAVSASFTIYSTSFCIVDSHLAAGATQGSAEDRAQDFNAIVTGLRLDAQVSNDEQTFEAHRDRVQSSASSSSSLAIDGPPGRGNTPQAGIQDSLNIFEHDVVIWAGDFNSRLWDDKNLVSPLARAKIFPLLQDSDSRQSLIARHDELSIQRAKGGIFASFEEAPFDFLPTYKLAPESNKTESNKVVESNRVENNNMPLTPFTPGEKSEEELTGERFNGKREPAYTDRVLWHARANVQITPTAYERVSSVNFSDHRPVRLAFRAVAREVRWDVVHKLCQEMRTTTRGQTVSTEQSSSVGRAESLDFTRHRSQRQSIFDVGEDTEWLAAAVPQRTGVCGDNSSCIVQ